MDGLVAGSEDGLVGYEEGGLPSFAFIHHQDHVEELVENPRQGLHNRHISLNSDITTAAMDQDYSLVHQQEVWKVLLSDLRVLVSRVAAGHKKPSLEHSSVC